MPDSWSDEVELGLAIIFRLASGEDERNRTTYRKPKPSPPTATTCTASYHRWHDHPRGTRLKRQRRRRKGQNDTQGEGRDPDDRMATSHVCAEIDGEAGVRSADHRKAENHVCVSSKRKKDRIRAEEPNNSPVLLSVQDVFCGRGPLQLFPTSHILSRHC